MISRITLSSREFDEDSSRAKRLVAEGPVFITERGKPSYVLLTMVQYRQIVGSRGMMATRKRRYMLADMITQCDLTAAPPVDMELWQQTPAVGREVL